MLHKKIGLILLVGIFLSACNFPALSENPATQVIPEMPTTTPALLLSVTPSITPLPPANTPTATLEPPSPTPAVTSTVPSSTPAPEGISSGAENHANMLYAIQPGAPRFMSGFPHPELGCGWTGVGGQVFGLDGQPVQLLIITLGGTLAGQPVNQVTLTGQSPAWGPGGYEFTLGNLPVASNGSIWLQVFDLSGNPISPRIAFSTKNDCAANTILINLVQVKTPENPPSKTYLPVISR